jgi:RWD domain
MAWNAAGAWKKPLNVAKKNDESSFPGLKPATPESIPKIQYEELQQDELTALEAIYGDDFVRHKETQTWQVLEFLDPVSGIFSIKSDASVRNLSHPFIFESNLGPTRKWQLL